MVTPSSVLSDSARHNFCGVPCDIRAVYLARLFYQILYVKGPKLWIAPLITIVIPAIGHVHVPKTSKCDVRDTRGTPRVRSVDMT